MDACSHADDVSERNPLGGRQVGWPEVRAGREPAAGSASDGSVEVSDLRITMLGNDAACTTGTEHFSANMAGTTISFIGRCTNDYRREGGAWKPIHHHLDLQPEALADVEAALGRAG